MDKLEEHMRKNRENLDRYSPSSGVWKRIKNGLKKEKSPISQWLFIAAMVIVILDTAVALLRPGYRWSDTGREKSIDARLTPANPQLQETEFYYNNLVNSLYRKASPLLTGNPEIEKELNADISQLDNICSEIKKDLKDNVANQEVVEALIQNYRIKIRLLEDILIVLKKNEDKTGKSKSHEL